MAGHFRWNKDYLLGILDQHIIDYPSPINLSYAWSFGALSGICLGIQILTGVFLAMHYTPHIDFAFSSVEHIMRDVNNGWLIRYMHANGASMFFIVVYCHIFRGLFLWFVYCTKRTSLVYWRCNFFTNDGYCIYGLCITLGTNEFLGCHCNYKSFFQQSLL